MKKLRIIFAALALIAGTSAFANPGVTVTEAVKKAFVKNFSSALHVNWEKKEAFYFANFEMGDHVVTVAYDEDGQMLGMSRTISISQVPLNVVQSVKDEYKGYRIASTVTEILFNGETNYYINVEGKSSIIKLRCDADGQVTEEKKARIKV
jgi:hypothetical protein